MAMPKIQTKLTASHWGIGLARTDGERILAIEAHASDPAPSAINDNIASSLSGAARVLRPAVRKSWLEGDAGKQARGRDSFIEVSWDRALDLIAAELKRVRSAHGNQAIFAGSYGWASAGRLHHAQSQLKRFLNSIGGFVRSKGNYSYNAALGLMPHIVGSYSDHVVQATRWSVIAQHSQLVVMFGACRCAILSSAMAASPGIGCRRICKPARALVSISSISALCAATPSQSCGRNGCR